MNDTENTLVYINGTIVLNYTGLQKDILIGNITFGMANVTVVYEIDGGMCSFRDEKLVEGQLVISCSCFCFHANTCMFSILLHNAPSVHVQ